MSSPPPCTQLDLYFTHISSTISSDLHRHSIHSAQTHTHSINEFYNVRRYVFSSTRHSGITSSLRFSTCRHSPGKRNTKFQPSLAQPVF
jgi:hypothetical protein